MKVCVVGLGYIGLPTAAIFAKFGADVIGVDLSVTVVNRLNRSEIHMEEPGLEPLVKSVVENGKFKARLKPEEADVFIVAVPTPNKNDAHRSCDLKAVESAIQSILPVVKKGNVMMIESTLAPCTMDEEIVPLVEQAGFNIGIDLFLSHCPERVLPGQILHELVHNNRIIGGITPACANASAEVYRLFVTGELIQTTAKTAEMSKLVENTFRDVNIALVNELTQICNGLEINVLDVIQMANRHPRVNLHQPGPGVGGHCLAVDPYFIVAKAPERAKMIKLSRETNTLMPEYVVKSVKALLKGIHAPKVAVFGVAYKGNVGDLRESPAINVIEGLLSAGIQVALHDPYVVSDKWHFVSVAESVAHADLMLILTDHDVFKTLNYDELAGKMNRPQLFDTRHCVRKEVANCGQMTLINFGNLYQFVK